MLGTAPRSRAVEPQREALYRLAQQGDTPAFKVGGSWRFRRSDIEEWISKQIEDQKPTRE